VSTVSSEQLRITGLTGVEITLDIAGAGSRSYAFIIDWHIRLLLALAWFFPTWFIATRSTGVIAPAYWVLIPALSIYFIYHPVLEILMRGSTPGKRMAGVRLVTRSGGTPSIGSLIVRNVFRIVDSMPAFYLVGLLCCLMTAQRVRIGDLAAGTLLILDASASTRSLGQTGRLVAQSGLPPNVAELIDDVLERWTSLEIDKRDGLARMLLSSADGKLTMQALAGLTDAELHVRLRALLAGER
jgi:uncharacterized RDD family membrane protein YckC